MAQHAHGSDRYENEDWRDAAGFLSREDNYYRLLDVPMDANRREITRAYRAIMLRWHPDRVGPEQRDHAEDLAKRLNLAYMTLADPVKREKYDQSIRAEVLQSEIMGRYVGGFATGPVAAAHAPSRPMTERERREQRHADRLANVSVLLFFAAIALAVILVLVIASALSYAGSALF